MHVLQILLLKTSLVYYYACAVHVHVNCIFLEYQSLQSCGRTYCSSLRLCLLNSLVSHTHMHIHVYMYIHMYMYMYVHCVHAYM